MQQTNSPSGDEEQVYTKLIQTYLNLLLYDNAIFLAEKYYASTTGTSTSSLNSLYLLAYCYYRNGNVKYARGLLVDNWLDRNDYSTTNTSSTNEVDVELENIKSSTRYLLAKCNYDLKLYNESEETILKYTRTLFNNAIIKKNGKPTLNGVTITSDNRIEVMDAWIVQQSSDSKVCPIANGAAGLHLLGNICRHTNRRKRAIDYYRLSLKLDPFLWTSYEALCELGGSKGMADEADDPNLIFGVDAPVLSPRHGMMNDMLDHGFMRAGGGNNGLVGGMNNTTQGGQQSTMGSFQLGRIGTPSTPYTGFGKMNIDTESQQKQPQTQQTQQQQGGGTAVNFHLPATASTIAPRTRSRKTGDGLPQNNLFAATPGLPTTGETPAAPSTTNAKTPGNNNDTLNDSAAIGYANQVLDRARRVVAGLTYEPSPESTNHRHPTSQRKVARFANELTFSSTPHIELSSSTTTTPAQQPSTTESVPFHAGVSTVKGEKRALFTTTEEEDNADVISSRKKSPKKEERAKEEMTQTSSEEDDTNNNNEVGNKTTGNGGGDLGLELDVVTENEHVGKILELLCGIGAAYKYLCQYHSQDALELFRELPPEQVNTGWVQHQIGKAYFEMSDYQNAERALKTMQKVDPHRIKGLDILSTTLWQLKKEVELSDLAQQAVDFDRMAPEAWFVVGNCFSLQKEHETAITFFRRSIQLNPAYTYAHTLCGHEFTSNEDFEKAISCYRDAIRVDSRHYNAWYGLGAIYFRQEKFDLAEYHFQRALDINGQSSVLHCHLGMAQHQNGKTMEALDTLAGAFRLDPRNPQAHYQRATIFMTLDRPEDALIELEKVRSAAPKEASVHFNLGKVHKRLGQPAKAMRCFLTALDLDPKDNNLIKAAMDRLDEPDVEEEQSVF